MPRKMMLGRQMRLSGSVLSAKLGIRSSSARIAIVPFHAGQRCTQAEMNAVSKGDMWVRVAGDFEGIRVLERLPDHGWPPATAG